MRQEAAATRPVRVLVVDDSAFMRKIIADMLCSDPGLVVAGVARDGVEALEQAAALAPDVITLDVEMPRLDGLSTLARLMAEQPRPVVMVSSVTQRGANATLRALTLGAVDFVAKPSGAISLDMNRTRDELIQKVKAASQVGRGRLRLPPYPPAATALPPAGRSKVVGGELTRLVVVAASTGGPGALNRLLSRLQGRLRAGLVVVQHMPPHFTRSLAEHLDQVSDLTVREAAAGDQVRDGLVLIAPGGHHLRLEADARVVLDDGPARHGVRPAADVTLESVPPALIPITRVVVLTGMGSDGAQGARWLADRGVTVWAQDEASAVVYGMPRAVAELGVVERSGPPEAIGGWIRDWCGAVGNS